MGFLSWFVIAALLLSLFVIALMVGIYRRSLNTVLLSVLLCVFGVGASCVAAYKFFKEVHTEAKKALKGRSAMEMYTAVLGKPGTDCVQILDYFDPVVPVMDDQLCICFKACPAEVKRILSRHSYKIEKKPTLPSGHPCGDSCFTTANFGDSVLVAEVEIEPMHYGMYISLDSTRVLYYDWK